MDDSTLLEIERASSGEMKQTTTLWLKYSTPFYTVNNPSLCYPECYRYTRDNLGREYLMSTDAHRLKMPL